MVVVGLIGAGIFAREVHFQKWIDLAKSGSVEIAWTWSRSEGSSKILAEKYNKELGLSDEDTATANGSGTGVDTHESDTKESKSVSGDGGHIGSTKQESKKKAIPHCFGTDQLELILKERKGQNMEPNTLHAVCIALPITEQPDVCKMALDSCIHVLVEKPIGGSRDQACDMLVYYDKLAKQCKDASKPVPLYCIAENFRNEQAFLKASEWLKETDKFGKVLQLSLVALMPHVKGNKYEQTEWRRDAEHIGGMLLDTGVHLAAAVRLLAGPDGANPKSVSAFVCKKSEHLPKVDSMVSIMQMDNDVQVSMNVTFASATRRWELRIIGEKGCISLTRGQDPDGRMGYIMNAEYENKTNDKENVFMPFSGVDTEIYSFSRLCEALCMENKSIDTLDGELQVFHERLSPQQAFCDFALVEACLRSGESGASCVEPMCM
eukprot:CAMPEP_0184699038 /NCGR_PEP_ID=MMETSP0313-20130426/5444_1 /TAXON_ID=2792 /ORGANISM="Porphyridium aerugineum, Strain SAG 1380-2" /LENGTH=434 /DNA_ID=CAMNT_0027158061 /DNA_START=187 /DNA_END=1491 /DNA_ORIENTATION=+